jgi:hypothetical protein
MERAMQETKHAGLQREKYDDLIAEIRWSEKELKDFTNQRINLMYRRQYTKQNVFFDDLFPYPVGKQDAFKYMIERTFMRPRDIIAFVNVALATSESQTEVTAKSFRKAEGIYSRKRLAALEEEWVTVYPALPQLIEHLHQKPELFGFTDFCVKDSLEYLALLILENSAADGSQIHKSAQFLQKENSPGTLNAFAKKCVEALYRVGCLGARIEKGESFRFSYCDEPVLNTSSISDDTRFRVHPMLSRALNAKPEDDE